MGIPSLWSLRSNGSVLSNMSAASLLSHASVGATLSARAASGGDSRPVRLCLAMLGLTGVGYLVVHRIYPGCLGRS